MLFRSDLHALSAPMAGGGLQQVPMPEVRSNRGTDHCGAKNTAQPEAVSNSTGSVRSRQVSDGLYWAGMIIVIGAMAVIVGGYVRAWYRGELGDEW